MSKAMSVADLHDLEFVWPSLSPTDVIVTGTFDQWSASIHLVRGNAGFSSTVKVPWGEKVTYKFIVDGHWECRGDRPQEDDGRGNINNVLLTPDKPPTLIYEPPPRLSIPLEPDGFDVENMVTAVEFLPLAEHAPIKGPLPLPVPQISVEGLGQAPSMSESRLDTAAATEGHVSPASETPAKLALFKEVPSSNDVATLPTNDKGPVSHLVVNGNGEAHSSHGATGHAVVDGEALESAVSQPSSRAVQDGPVPIHRADEPSAGVPGTASESAAKQSQVGSVEAVAQSSTAARSASTPKKRRSWFARIKHLFEKDKEKQGKEKNKH